MTARDDGDEYRDAIEDARAVALKPGATAADVARALESARRPLVAFAVETGRKPAASVEEPTSPGRPSPLRSAEHTHTEAKS